VTSTGDQGMKLLSVHISGGPVSFANTTSYLRQSPSSDIDRGSERSCSLVHVSGQYLETIRGDVDAP
jgi:hypothetical protein